MFLTFLKSTRVLVVIYLIVITAIIIIGYESYRQDKINERRSRANELQSINQIKHNSITQWLHERYSDAAYLFNNYPLTLILNKYAGSGSYSDSMTVVNTIGSIYLNHDYFNIVIINPRHNIILDLNPSLEFEVLKDSLLSSVKSNKIVFSNLYEDRFLNLAVMDIYVPVFDNDSNYIASIVLKVDPQKVLYNILTSWSANTRSGESLIVTPITDGIVFISPLKFLPGEKKFLTKSSKDTFLPAVQAVMGEEGVVEGKDYRGIEVLASVKPVNVLPWILVSKIDLDEVYEPTMEYTFANLVIICLIAVLGGISLLFYHTRLNFNHLKKASESEKKFKSIFEDSTNAIYLLDNITIIDCNASAEELIGVPKKAIVGKTPIDFSPEFQLNGERTSELVSTIIRSVLNGKPQRFEWILFRQGKIIYADVSLSAITIDRKKFIAAFLWDITDYKLAEFALRESEDKYRSLIENIEDIVYAFDANSLITFINSAVEKVTGYKPEEVIGKPFSEFIHPDDLKKAMTRFEQLPVNKVSYGEYRIRTKSGNYKYISSTISGIINGSEFIGARGILTDITDRVLSAQQIKILSKAIEQSPVSVVLTDPEGNIKFVNTKFTEVTGYSKEEVRDLNPRILKSGSQSTEFYKELWTTISSGNIWQGELHNKRKNGELFWENVIISPIIDETGKVINFIAVKEDITEKKKMIEDLVHEKEKAEKASMLKSIFLANMSHELRTPLVGILGFAEMLSHEQTNPEQLEMIDTILLSGNRLMSTLNSILDISRIEADKQDLKFSNLVINDLLKDSVKLYSSVAKQNGLALKLSLPAEDIIIKSDKDILLKIFNNLISNAIKFTQEGSIKVSCYINEELNDSVIVDVTDTGIGILEKFQSIIFEPFRQVSEGLTRSFEGTGLGLSIAKKYISLLNGSIDLKSEPGRGSTFSVRLPYSSNDRDETLPEHKPTGQSASDPSSLSILLVEDDLLNASVISAYLKGYTSLLHVLSGEQAIRLCKESNYDAVLMDINLKGINGIQTLNEIREISNHYRNIPIIAVTAFAMKGDREKFLSLGFDHYVSKPFQREQIVNLLDQIFNKYPAIK